jgi:hypothetical protein
MRSQRFRSCVVQVCQRLDVRHNAFNRAVGYSDWANSADWNAAPAAIAASAINELCSAADAIAARTTEYDRVVILAVVQFLREAHRGTSITMDQVERLLRDLAQVLPHENRRHELERLLASFFGA